MKVLQTFIYKSLFTCLSFLDRLLALKCLGVPRINPWDAGLSVQSPPLPNYAALFPAYKKVVLNCLTFLIVVNDKNGKQIGKLEYRVEIVKIGKIVANYKGTAILKIIGSSHIFLLWYLLFEWQYPIDFF